MSTSCDGAFRDGGLRKYMICVENRQTEQVLGKKTACRDGHRNTLCRATPHAMLANAARCVFKSSAGHRLKHRQESFFCVRNFPGYEVRIWYPCYLTTTLRPFTIYNPFAAGFAARRRPFRSCHSASADSPVTISPMPEGVGSVMVNLYM